MFFEVQTVLSNHVAAVLPAALIGLACGVCGILFTVMNLKVTRLRELYIGVRSCLHPATPARSCTASHAERSPVGPQADKRRRLLEPVIFVAVFVTLAMILPLFFPCTRTDCVIEQARPVDRHVCRCA